jgi:hypothetical protein
MNLSTCSLPRRKSVILLSFILSITATLRHLLIVEQAALQNTAASIPQSGRDSLNSTSTSSHNYFQKAISGYFPSSSELQPLKVLESYIQQHSQAQLEREWSECILNKQNVFSLCQPLSQRKYIVGVYSCPHSSGNLLHRFMNGLILSIATNRTFLWRYYSTPNLINEYNESNMADILGLQTKSDCDAILELSKWVPSYEEWDTKVYGFPSIERAELWNVNVDFWATPYDRNESPVVIRVGRQMGLDPMGLLGQVGDLVENKFLIQRDNLDRVQQLKIHGVYFLYGMIFESLFTIREEFLPDPSQVSDIDTHDAYFLHSRHPDEGDNGAYTWPEEWCLQNAFFANNTSTRPCTVYLMSDRQISIERLSAVIQNTSCTVQRVTNHTTKASQLADHGSFAGAGFWQDWALAINARKGGIAFHMHRRAYLRTSTSLVREVIEFRRVLESSSPSKHNGHYKIKVFVLWEWDS